jgi:hypothetical protein
MKAIKFLSMLAVAALTFNSCSNDDDAPAPVNEEEVITTVIVTLTPQGSGTAVTLTSRDLDGDGPNAPVVSVTGPLNNNSVYNGSVQFLNELENPAEDITEEVAEEDLEHQVFYNVTGGIGTITYTDSDPNGNPVGLSFTLSTSASATTGVMTVILRHEPEKDAAGVSEGDITNAGGETDTEVSFNVAVN